MVFHFWCAFGWCFLLFFFWNLFFFVQNIALQKKKKKKKKKKKHVLLGSTGHDACDPLRGSGEEQK